MTMTMVFMAAIAIVAPKQNETVSQLWPEQKQYYDLPRAEREAFNWARRDTPEWKALKKVKNSARPVDVEWTGAEGETEVRVCRLPDRKVFFQVKTLADHVAITGRLEVARQWELTVQDAKGECGQTTFSTEDRAPRIITLEGTGNVRDLGGWIGLNGRRVRQGLVLRNQGLNRNAKTEYYSYDEVLELHRQGKLASAGPWKSRHVAESYERTLAKGKDLDRKYMRLYKNGPTECGKERLTAADKDYLLGFIGVRTDLDFRDDWECWGMTGSPLGDSVKWVHYEYVSAYGGLNTPLGRASAARNFSVFVDHGNYPIDFHCIGGADRTGTWAYLMGAFLGVDEEDLIRDYQTTFLGGGGPDKRHADWLAGMVKAVRSLPGETLADKMRTYFISLGFKPEDVDAVRERLLEPPEGMSTGGMPVVPVAGTPVPVSRPPTPRGRGATSASTSRRTSQGIGASGSTPE